MPILNNKFTFIHIPKTGGTSIEKLFEDLNLKISLFTRTGYTSINNHTPQHCTYRELEHLGVLTEKIFTIVRPHVDRTISEYFYSLEKRLDLKNLYTSFDSFLDLFLNYDNTSLFDNHNLPNSNFLINHEGVVDEKIKIFNFYDIAGIEKYLNVTGLEKYHEMKPDDDRYSFTLKPHQRERILNFFKTEI